MGGTPQVIVAISAVHRASQKVLLIHRNKDPYANYFAFPGGKVEFNESIQDAAIREFDEETGYLLDDIELISILHEIYNEEDKQVAKFIVYYYIAELQELFIPENGEEGELEWHTMDLELRIVPSDGKILNLIKKKDLDKVRLFEGILSKRSVIQDPNRLLLEKWDEM